EGRADLLVRGRRGERVGAAVRVDRERMREGLRVALEDLAGRVVVARTELGFEEGGGGDRCAEREGEEEDPESGKHGGAPWRLSDRRRAVGGKARPEARRTPSQGWPGGGGERAEFS